MMVRRKPGTSVKLAALLIVMVAALLILKGTYTSSDCPS